MLGVTDKRPRRVVGSQAFRGLEGTRAGLLERLHLCIEADSFTQRGARVVVLTVPAPCPGGPIAGIQARIGDIRARSRLPSPGWIG